MEENNSCPFWGKYSKPLFFGTILIIVAYVSVILLGKNNPVELDIEKVIEVETGLKVDLTP